MCICALVRLAREQRKERENNACTNKQVLRIENGAEKKAETKAETKTFAHWPFNGCTRAKICSILLAHRRSVFRCYEICPLWSKFNVYKSCELCSLLMTAIYTYAAKTLHKSNTTAI